MHNGEKSNKCDQCDFALIQADDLKRLTWRMETQLECWKQFYIVMDIV